MKYTEEEVLRTLKKMILSGEVICREEGGELLFSLNEGFNPSLSQDQSLSNPKDYLLADGYEVAKKKVN